MKTYGEIVKTDATPPSYLLGGHKKSAFWGGMLLSIQVQNTVAYIHFSECMMSFKKIKWNVNLIITLYY